MGDVTPHEVIDCFDQTVPGCTETPHVRHHLVALHLSHQIVAGLQQVPCLILELLEEANLTLSAPIRYAPFMPKEPPLDPWHESRMRLSIQFPDKRLLQYDCGKLQRLDALLRRLQAGGHRALIFTQMTKVLDILEQFLNIHGLVVC